MQQWATNANGDKSKLKSGKYAKTNINIKIQEQWPHMNTMRKYCKHTSFDQMEFDAFVAGETRVILGCEDDSIAQACLDFLSRVAHWVCRSKD